MDNIENIDREETIHLLEEQNEDAPISVLSDDEDIPNQDPYPEVGGE